MKINDVLCGVLAACFSVLVFVIARGFGSLPGQSVGPGVFPQMIAAGIMVCALTLLFRGLRAPCTGPWIVWPSWLADRRAAVGFLLIPTVLAFYVAVAERLGFIPTAMILLIALFLVFRVTLQRAVFIATIGTVAVHTLFYKLLKVPLPWGVLNPVAW